MLSVHLRCAHRQHNKTHLWVKDKWRNSFRFTDRGIEISICERREEERPTNSDRYEKKKEKYKAKDSFATIWDISAAFWIGRGREGERKRGRERERNRGQRGERERRKEEEWKREREEDR